jgi:hypothetical protein
MLLGIIFNPEDGGDIFFGNVCCSTEYTALLQKIEVPTPTFVFCIYRSSVPM